MKKIISTTMFCCACLFVSAQQESDSVSKNLLSDNRVSLTYDHTKFDKQFDTDWQLVSFEYSRKVNSGTYVGRMNYGKRYGHSGAQIEVEAYPRISKIFYGYIGIGYSPDFPVFSKFNAAVSLFANLPRAFEADAGLRYLNFNNNTWVYTASAGKYAGNFWFNFRTYVTPASTQINQSHILTARYYLKSADDYLSLVLGSGISPDDRSQAVQLNTKFKLKSQKAVAGYRFCFNRNVAFIQASVANVEYLQDMKDKQVNFIIGLQRKF